jgi:hypothetical protein
VVTIAGFYVTPISSNWNVLPVAQLLLYSQTFSQCGTRLQKQIEQHLQQKETYCLLFLSDLWCQNTTEANND